MSQRGDMFERLLNLFEPGRLVDLGTGHGGFARKAADNGWSVTAVDARNDRWPEDGRIEWVQEDVRIHDLRGYDVIACLGLFYHLTCSDQIALIRRCSGTPTIIDTHLDHGDHDQPVSERFTSQEGYEGCLYREPGKTTSAWLNSESFWPTLESFYSMLTQNGFQMILGVEPWYLPDRTFFLALPR